MIDYLALMEHLPVILVVTAVLALLIGVPYLLEKTFFQAENENNTNDQ